MENLTQDEKIIIKEFGTPIDRISRGFLTLKGLYEIIRNSKTVQQKGLIINNEEIEFDRRVKCWDVNYCDKRQEDMFSRLEIYVNQDVYKMRTEGQFIHKQGERGENVIYCFLKKNHFPVFVSIQYLAYDTMSDDSEDRNTRVIKRNELLDPLDEIALEIFEESKRLELKEL